MNYFIIKYIKLKEEMLGGIELAHYGIDLNNNKSRLEFNSLDFILNALKNLLK